MSWVQDLPHFLPKYVSKLPSLAVAGVVFFIVLFVFYNQYYRRKDDWFPKSQPTSNLSSSQLKIKNEMLFGVYILFALTSAYAVSNGAFDLKWMLDNHHLNKEWSVYQTYWNNFK